MEAQRLRRSEPATGELFTHPPEHMVLQAQAQKLTGTMEFGEAEAMDAGRPAASVVFQRGLVHKTKAAHPLYLGGILYERGFIDAQTLNETLLEVARTKRPHGSILLARGAIAHADLQEALSDQMERRIAMLVALPSSLAWRFYADVDTLSGFGGDDWPTVDPAGALWRGIRENGNEAQVARAVARLANHPVRLHESFDPARYRFDREETALVARLRQAVRANELGGESPRIRRLAERMLYCFLLAKQLDVRDGNARPNSVQPPRTSGTMPSQAPSASVPPASAVRPSAAGRPSEAAASTPSSVGAFRVRMPTETVSGKYKSVTVSGTHERAQVAPTLAVDVQREAIRKRAKNIENESYFRALGLSRDATTTDVQTAYYRLCKIWHPDRLAPELESVREESGKVFAYITRAYQTLTNAEERAVYLLELSEDGTHARALAPPSTDPAADFRAAEQALAQGFRERAEPLARRAHEARPKDGDYAALLTWIEATDPDDQSDRRTLAFIARLNEIIETCSPSTRAYWYRGLLHKKLNQVRSALRDFRDVLVLDPRHCDAEREIRLFEMRYRNGTLPVRTASGEIKAVGAGGKSVPPRHDSIGNMIASWLKKD